MINRLLKSQFILLIVIFSLSFVLNWDQFLAVSSAYLLSFGFVVSSTLIVTKFWNSDSSTFLKAFILSIPVRFFVVLVSFILLLVITKIDEIYFTVSFIISYLYHSITETIFINKILKKGSSTT